VLEHTLETGRLTLRAATADDAEADDASCVDTIWWRSIERVRMRRGTHAIHESLHRSGRWLDAVGYAVLAEEWSRGGNAHISVVRADPNSGPRG
jgi:RimJ/RimL family protein N-acetyltransferase